MIVGVPRLYEALVTRLHGRLARSTGGPFADSTRLVGSSAETLHEPADDLGGQVSDGFAVLEGDGDKTLRYWREAHWRSFSRECQRIGREPDLHMPVVCE
jgi:hypothetical protein